MESQGSLAGSLLLLAIPPRISGAIMCDYWMMSGEPQDHSGMDAHSHTWKRRCTSFVVT